MAGLVIGLNKKTIHALFVFVRHLFNDIIKQIILKGGENMDNTEKFEHWKDIAKYDLDTAEAMYRAGRYLYVVFMCQQAIEKLTKGLYVLERGEEAPRT